MQRVIGLDIGSYSIKAVEIVNTFKSYEITNFYENVIPRIEGVPMESIAPSVMEQLFVENKLEADRIVTAMPGQFISSRVLTLGFSDPRKVETAVFAEVEEAVPFSMDDMILDHQILGQMGDQTVALAVMTRKAFLRNFLDLLARIQIDPKLVDIDSLAFYNLSSFMEINPGECFAMVDIGHEKTSVCIIRDGLLRLFRSINLGGRYITEFLARDLETSFTEAQRIKHEVSSVFCSTDPGTNRSGDEKLVIERTTLAVNAIIKELGRTIYAFKTWERQPLSKIYLSGGASQTGNIAQLIKDQLEVETVHCRLDQTSLKISEHLNPNMSIMPQSVAIGMRTVSSIKKHSQINLRRGEFAYVQNYEVILKACARFSQVLAAVISFLILSFGFKYWVYGKHIRDLEQQYVKEYSKLYPEDKTSFSGSYDFPKARLSAEKKIQARVSSMQGGIDFFTRDNHGSGALVALAGLSRTIPKEMVMDLTRYEYKTTETGGSIALRVETDGYEQMAQIMDAIAKVPNIKNVEEKKAGKKPGSEKIEFNASAVFDPGLNGKG